MNVDCRVIRKKTGCTEDQAKYLAVEIRKLPKLKDQIMKHLDKVNLYNCDKVELVRHFGYRDDGCNINGYRPDANLSYGESIIYNIFKHSFNELFKDEVFISIL